MAKIFKKKLLFLLYIFLVFSNLSCLYHTNDKVTNMLTKFEDECKDQALIQQIKENRYINVLYCFYSYSLLKYEELFTAEIINYFNEKGVFEKEVQVYVLLLMLERHLDHLEVFPNELIRKARHGANGVNSCEIQRGMCLGDFVDQ